MLAGFNDVCLFLRSIKGHDLTFTITPSQIVSTVKLLGSMPLHICKQTLDIKNGPRTAKEVIDSRSFVSKLGFISLLLTGTYIKPTYQ